MAIEVLRDAKTKAVTGWKTTCSKCGVVVQFRKGAAGRDSSPTPPDERAVCRDCYDASLNRYRAERAGRHDA